MIFYQFYNSITNTTIFYNLWYPTFDLLFSLNTQLYKKLGLVGYGIVNRWVCSWFKPSLCARPCLETQPYYETLGNFWVQDRQNITIEHIV